MVEPPLLSLGGSFGMRYALTAALLALIATAVAHLLVLTAPRPEAFFSWIVGLVTVVGIVLPLTLDGTFAGRASTAIGNLVIGLCVLSLLRSVLLRTARPGVRQSM